MAMPTVTIDGLEVNYVTRGNGTPLLMLAPGGFDATLAKWTTAGVWKSMRPLDTLGNQFMVIAYDRRESGASGGRVERLSIGIREAFVLGGCMGCSVALGFAARFPEATRALVLHWPVGGYRWKLNGNDGFARHLKFARENGLVGVVKRAHEGRSFWQDPEAGPWASAIVRDPGFADAFPAQDPERYVGIVAASAPRPLRSGHAARGRARGDDGHEGARPDHAGRRSLARHVRCALPPRVAAPA